MTSIAPTFVPHGLLTVHDQDLVGIVMVDDYIEAGTEEFVADIVGDEVDGVGYVRLTAHATVELIGGAWVLLLTDTTGTPLDMDRAGVWWAIDGASDAVRRVVFYDADPGGPIDPYLPTYPEGAVDYPIEAIDEILADLRADLDAIEASALPAPLDGSPGQVPAVNATSDGYELVDPATGGSTGTFVFNSAGDQTGNRYNDWAGLIAAVGAVDGAKVIEFEEHETIPTGAWDLNGATLTGQGNYPLEPGDVIVTFPTGCTITNPATMLAHRGIALYSTSTAPVLTMPAGGSVYLSDDALLSSKSCEFLRITSDGPNVIVSLRNGAGCVPPSSMDIATGDYEAVAILGTPNFAAVVEASGTSRLLDDQLRGDVATVYRVPPPLTSPGTEAQGDTQTNLAGWTVLSPVPAKRVAYAPATPGDWAGSPPSTIGEAVDRLAAVAGSAP